MARFACHTWLAVVLLAGFGFSAYAADSSADGVVDPVGLFRPEIVARADALIQKLHRDYGFDVRLETLEPLADVEHKKLEGLASRRTQARYFAELARERVEKANINGLYILISTKPAHTLVTVHPKAAASLFSSYQQRQLTKLLDTQLHAAKPSADQRDAVDAAVGIGWRARPASGSDLALLSALNQVNTVLRERAGDPNAVRAWPVGIALLAGVGIWLVLAIARRRMARRDPNAGLFVAMQPDQRAALLASQFGSPAALWIYDRLFVGPTATSLTSTAAQSAEIAAGPTNGDQEATDQFDRAEPDHADTAAGDGAD